MKQKIDFFATLFSESVQNNNDVSIADVSKAAGHADSVITERVYVHPHEKTVSKAFSKYEQMPVS